MFCFRRFSFIFKLSDSFQVNMMVVFRSCCIGYNVCKLVAFGSKEPFLYPPLIKKLKYKKLSFLHLCPNAINLLLAAGYCLGSVSLSSYNTHTYEGRRGGERAGRFFCSFGIERGRCELQMYLTAQGGAGRFHSFHPLVV